jgi:hypothetical protein
VSIGNSDIELYSLGVSECMEEDLREPSFTQKKVNEEDLYLIEWTVEYKAYGNLPSDNVILVHPNGSYLDLSANSFGRRLGIHEYENTNCSVDINDTYIEKICLKVAMGPISGSEAYRIEEIKTTTVIDVTSQGFIEGDEQTVTRDIQGNPEEIFHQLEDLPWKLLVK